MASPRDFVFDDQGEMLPSDSAAAAARRKELGTTPKPPTRPGQQVSGAKPVASKTKPAAKAKPAIVTKEELAKSGLSLRDYLNKQRGLTRRDGKAPEKAKPSTPAAKASEDNRPKASGAMIQSMDTDMMRNLSRKEARFEGAKRMAKTPEGQAKRKEQERGQALERVSPEEYIGPAFGLKTLSKLAKNLATPKVKKYNPKMLPAPKAAAKTDTKALPAPKDKRGMKDKERAQRAADREKQKDSDNIRRGGRLTGGRDIELKKGGKVCMASERADGIAVKGKTRGKVY